MWWQIDVSIYMMSADKNIGMLANSIPVCHNIGGLQQRLSTCQMTLTLAATELSNDDQWVIT